MKALHLILFPVFIVVCCGCIYPYEPQSVNEIENLLVVDGDIIANGTTIVKLTRSYKLSYSAETTIPIERNARVVVESSTGVVYPADETSPGCYEAATDGLDLSARYRLHITTRDNMEYASQFVPVSISPPIDSLSWVVNQGGKCVNIYVSTHDPTDKTHYYRWNYVQIWEFTSEYYAMITFDRETGEYVDFPNSISPYYYCWIEQNSSAILLDKTSMLSQSVINNKKLITIDEEDQRISLLYSVQVIQRALTADGYAYWENLYKNGQDLGGIFAPMPTEQRGNIYCLSQPKQIVLGFISATTLTYSDRIFIERPFRLPINWICQRGAGEIQYDRGLLIAMFPHYLPVAMVSPFQRRAIWAQRVCVDCTVKGTKNKPLWWPNDHQ